MATHVTALALSVCPSRLRRAHPRKYAIVRRAKLVTLLPHSSRFVSRSSIAKLPPRHCSRIVVTLSSPPRPVLVALPRSPSRLPPLYRPSSSKLQKYASPSLGSAPGTRSITPSPRLAISLRHALTIIPPCPRLRITPLAIAPSPSRLSRSPPSPSHPLPSAPHHMPLTIAPPSSRPSPSRPSPQLHIAYAACRCS